PRRLVVRLNGLPPREPDREEQVMGPPVRAAYAGDGSPTPALLGFARRCGVEPAALLRVATEKGEYVAAARHTAGRPAAEVLSELLPRLLTALSWPKTMRWGEGVGPWVRPVHGVVSLLDGEVVPFELFGIAAGDETAGHPILSPRPLKVRGAAEYRRKLASRHIEIDPKRRRTVLAAAMHERAAALGGRLVEDGPLLDKLAALCEIPGVLEGSFDPAFLELPAEVLATSLRDHQSALTVAARHDPPGSQSSPGSPEPAVVEARLLPCFLTVMDRPDDPAGRARSGNEWVVAARLADARFFYGEDLAAGLGRRAEQLARLAFHERLGSYADKTVRLVALAGTICDELGWGGEAAAAAAAARLLKVDLATEMVKEFTSLQGVMGGLYARREGHPEDVWQAIYDQYLPISAEDPIPRGRAGRVAGLADRFDTLVGMFGLGLVPTGSKDPFGLRRAAQGAVRIAFEGGLAVDFERLTAAAAALYGDRLGRGAAEAWSRLRPFLDDRIRYVLGIYGYAYDEIEAALAAGAANLPDLRARVDAIHRVRGEAAFLSVVLAAKRIANIVKDLPDQPFEPERLGEPAEPAERELAAAFAGLRAEVEAAAAAGDYERALRRIAGLAPVLDRFFVEVLVMDPDERVRANRIALLQAILRTVSRTARLTEVVVDRAEHRARAGAVDNS
ncbi:MAG TPA: glycine--tRNA ligase subunit beta, partial [Thermoanaerobaculia bacterium]|nr:glycine--tRNA ligase subunit beta [Thermoanaerobaculia bacterium]